MSGDTKGSSGSGQTVNPGDAAPPGTPGTGENVCPQCAGSGKVGAAPCQTCGGTGKVVEGVGGA
jgi:DnaJ-class molecular chaperone